MVHHQRDVHKRTVWDALLLSRCEAVRVVRLLGSGHQPCDCLLGRSLPAAGQDLHC